MAKAKKALFTSFGLLNFQEHKVLNEGNAFFEATPEGGKSDKTFCITLDDGKQMYCYVSNDKLTFYKANLDGTHKQWLFNIFPDGGIFSAHSIENKKRKKEQTKAQKPERRTLTLSKASHQKASIVVEVTKKKR
ncbi:hypothetical protein [Acetobacter okinawensis]|uniref:hypothetical protein n=1 Tax=Acetobacter okinawensis TaxID=1076594 RepID=UPI00209F3860|nr:hypothetical protein [Acetobacter okinawensis]MCP1214435.1 hypothetical protein [Acetobacter okinawensis]